MDKQEQAKIQKLLKEQAEKAREDLIKSGKANGEDLELKVYGEFKRA